MFKLSLGEKIKFRNKEGVGLKRDTLSPSFLFEDYDIVMYKTKEIAKESSKSHKKKGYWAVERKKGGKRYTHISTKEIVYIQIDGAVYLFGTEGIFYKKEKDELLECILSGYQYTGCIVYPENNAVVTFGEFFDVIYLLNGTNRLFKIVNCNQIKRIRTYKNQIDREKISKEEYTSVPIITEENEKYGYYYMNKSKLFHYDVKFYSFDDVRFAQKGELMVAYSKKEKNNVVVSIVGGELKVFDNYDEVIPIKSPRLEESYYLARKYSDGNPQMHILRHIRNINMSTYQDLGEIPNGEYKFCDQILDVVFYKLRDNGETVLIAIDKDKIKTIHYKADDILISKPEYLVGDKIVEVKPVFMFKKRESKE